MRLIIAAVVGTVIVFIWGVVSWTMLDLWSEQIRDLPGEDATISEIAKDVPGTGAYVFPARPEVSDSASKDERAEAEQAWLERVRTGPSGVLLVHPGGYEPKPSGMFIRGLLLEFAGSFLLAVLLGIAGRAGAGYGGRLAIGIAALAFAVVGGVLVPGNFMVHPAGWTRAMAGDLILGWGLALVVMAAIVRTPKKRGGRYARS